MIGPWQNSRGETTRGQRAVPAFRLPLAACRLLLTAVFLWAGVAKLRGPHLFAADLGAFRLWPGSGAAGSVALAVAYYLPWLEILGATGLWLPRWRTAALGLGTALLAGFTLALGSAWLRGIHLDCGCFGAGRGTNLPLAIARNLLLLGACALLWAKERSDTSERG